MHRAAEWLLIAALAWGALAFGAVYAWAYWPLAALLAALGLFGLTKRPPAGALGLRWLGAALALFAAAAAVQLLPLPLAAARTMSPNGAGLLQELVPAVAAGVSSSHPLSIDPALTRTALLLFTAFALFVGGGARLLSQTGATRTAERLTVLGVVLALVGIVQKPFFAGRIYGFWRPEEPGAVFGPFVNRNHFAGWMAMAVPLALGLLCAGISRGLPEMKPGWRHRLLWLDTPEASRLVLLGVAAVVMSMALVLTMSRSGMSALALAVALTGAVAVRRAGSGSRRAAALGYLALLVVVVVAWVGADAIVRRFGQLEDGAVDARRGAWADARGVVADFPLAGTGLNTYGLAMVFYQRHGLAFHFAQAHDDYLQLAAEGGALLVVPALCCAGAFAVAVRRRFRDETSRRAYWLRVGAVTGLIAIAFQETVEFSLQMPGNAALFAFLCAIALHRAPPHRAVPAPSSSSPRHRRPRASGDPGPAARRTEADAGFPLSRE